jgi:predicted permease
MKTKSIALGIAATVLPLFWFFIYFFVKTRLSLDKDMASGLAGVCIVGTVISLCFIVISIICIEDKNPNSILN